MGSARQRISKREQQIASLTPQERTEELLMLAARDIAATQTHVTQLQHRHLLIVERVAAEELTLRKLVTEIREHRREIRILAAEVARGGRPRGGAGGTVAGRLATLRETRAAIAGNVSDADVAELSFAEATERVDGDPLDRELASRGRDPASMELAGVLARLKGMPSPDAASP